MISNMAGWQTSFGIFHIFGAKKWIWGVIASKKKKSSSSYVSLIFYINIVPTCHIHSPSTFPHKVNKKVFILFKFVGNTFGWYSTKHTLVHTQYLTTIISDLLLSIPEGGSVSHCPCLTHFIIVSTITDIRQTYREINIIIIRLTLTSSLTKH